MNILIFDIDAKGHHLEYIHNLYMYAYYKLAQNQITFVLHPDFQEMFRYRDFPSSDNIQIVYMHQKEIDGLDTYSFESAYKSSVLLKKYYSLFTPDYIFLNTVITFMPFLPFLIRRKKIISGIEYAIPARRSGKVTLKKRIEDILKMSLYSFSSCFNVIFLLNDRECPLYYNKIYHTHTFRFLADPYVPINSTSAIKSIPLAFLEKSKRIFLHCGGLGERKGTFNILKAIKALSKQERDKALFIFAGRISSDNFYKKFIESINQLSASAHIQYIEGFLRFEELGYLFEIADYILIPYTNVENSSGIIGYAAQYNKPVIGPKEGLLGDIIDFYHLGITISQLDAHKLKNTIAKMIEKDIPDRIDGNDYLNTSSIDNFTNTIFSVMK